MAKNKKTDQPQLNPDGGPRTFSWVAAGMEDIKRHGASIYVKYGRYPNRIVVKETSPGHMWIQCPDRELFITCREHQGFNFRPMQGTFDECTVLSPYHPHTAKDLGFEYVMTNYATFMSSNVQSCEIRRSGRPPGSWPIVLSDSGGYQLFTGDVEYIDPLKLVQWYNENADLGMALDLPVSVAGEEYYKRVAKIQAENTRVMMENKRPDLELFNIFHGTTQREVDLYRKIVERDDIDRLAIGGSYFGTVLASLDRLFEIVLTGKKYKHYHVLGIQNILQTIPMMRLASSGLVPLMTSDSTSHVQSAVMKQYQVHVHPSEPMRALVTGDRRSFPNPNITLPCNCPVCSAVKYLDVMTVCTGAAIDSVFLYHNLFTAMKYMNTMYDYIKGSTTKELKELLLYQLGGKNKRNGYQETLHAIDYIDAIQQEGLAKARKRFAYYLPSGFKHEKSNSTLFKRNDLVDETVTPKDSDDYKQMDALATRYETHSGQHGRRVLKKEPKFKNLLGAKPLKTPGKKRKVKKTKKAKKSKTTPVTESATTITTQIVA